MTKRYLGNIITQNPTAPADNFETTSAPGVWSLAEALAYKKANLWPTAGNAAPGQQAYTSAGTYPFTAPGTSSVSVVCIGSRFRQLGPALVLGIQQVQLRSPGQWVGHCETFPSCSKRRTVHLAGQGVGPILDGECHDI